MYGAMLQLFNCKIHSLARLCQAFEFAEWWDLDGSQLKSLYVLTQNMVHKGSRIQVEVKTKTYRIGMLSHWVLFLPHNHEKDPQ